MSMLNTAHITISDATLHQQLDDETILLHLDTEYYYGLDDIGSRIWQLLKQHGRVDHIVADMLREYDVEEVTLRGDIECLLSEMARAGLIQIALEPGA